MEKHQVSFRWVKGHNGHPQNERCDELATTAADGTDLLVDEGMGYAITLDKLINCSGESNLCFRPFYPLKPAQMYLVWKKYQVFSKAAERFLEDFKRETIQ